MAQASLRPTQLILFPVSNTELAVAAPNNIAFCSRAGRKAPISREFLFYKLGAYFFLNLCTFSFDMYWDNEHVRKCFQGSSISPETITGVLLTITGNLLEEGVKVKRIPNSVTLLSNSRGERRG